MVWENDEEEPTSSSEETRHHCEKRLLEDIEEKLLSFPGMSSGSGGNTFASSRRLPMGTTPLSTLTCWPIQLLKQLNPCSCRSRLSNTAVEAA